MTYLFMDEFTDDLLPSAPGYLLSYFIISSQKITVAMTIFKFMLIRHGEITGIKLINEYK